MKILHLFDVFSDRLGARGGQFVNTQFVRVIFIRDHEESLGKSLMVRLDWIGSDRTDYFFQVFEPGSIISKPILRLVFSVNTYIYHPDHRPFPRIRRFYFNLDHPPPPTYPLSQFNQPHPTFFFGLRELLVLETSFFILFYVFSVIKQRERERANDGNEIEV